MQLPALFQSFATVSATCWNSFLPGRRPDPENPSRPALRSAAQDDDALVRVLEEGLDRIAAEIGIHGDRVRAVALEGLVRVLLGGAADVAALGVEDHDGIRAASS